MQINVIKFSFNLSTDCFFNTGINETATAKIKKATSFALILCPILLSHESLANGQIDEAITLAANNRKQEVASTPKLENTL